MVGRQLQALRSPWPPGQGPGRGERASELAKKNGDSLSMVGCLIDDIRLYQNTSQLTRHLYDIHDSVVPCPENVWGVLVPDLFGCRVEFPLRCIQTRGNYLSAEIHQASNRFGGSGGVPSGSSVRVGIRTQTAGDLVF